MAHGESNGHMINDVKG